MAKGKHNALEVLGRVSGLGTDEARRIFEQVKVNQARLDACEGPHDFCIEHRRVGTIVRDYKCRKCGGVLDSINVGWYKRGLEHAGRELEGAGP